MSTVSVNGSPVHYSVTGAGPGLVLIHGASMDGVSNFGHLVDKFTDERTVVLPDYAGSGETPLPAEELSIDLLLDQVVAAISEATTGQVDVVGISLGAVVAAAVAAKHPDLVRRLVLVAGWSHLDDPRLRLGLETWGAVMDSPELHSAVGPLMAFGPAFLSSLGPDGLATLRAGKVAPGTRQQLDLILQVDIRDQLPLVQAPTLVVGCALDYLIPVQHARALHESLPGSHYLELESGHVVTAEKPTEIVAVLRDFLLPDRPKVKVAR